jgi:hypothetical protein
MVSKRFFRSSTSISSLSLVCCSSEPAELPAVVEDAASASNDLLSEVVDANLSSIASLMQTTESRSAHCIGQSDPNEKTSSNKQLNAKDVTALLYLTIATRSVSESSEIGDIKAVNASISPAAQQQL